MPHAAISHKKRIFAKRLRSEMTDAEAKLWADLRAHRLTDLHFRRQTPVGPYIVDFICHEARVIVELDGEQHALGAAPARDRNRDDWFTAQGYLTLRFWNHEIFQELDAVTDTIFARCAERLSAAHEVNRFHRPPSLTLPHKGGGKAAEIAPDQKLVRQNRAAPRNLKYQTPSSPAPSPLVGEGEGGGYSRKKRDSKSP